MQRDSDFLRRDCGAGRYGLFQDRRKDNGKKNTHLCGIRERGELHA